MMRPIVFTAFAFAGISTFPLVAAAQPPGNFVEFAEFLLSILRGVTAILLTAAVVGLTWGVVLYFANADNPQKRESIRPYLLWSVIGIAVVFGVWGFVELLYVSFFGSGGFGFPFIRPPAP